MPLPDHLQAAPRSVGEILDDAWRLYRAEAPLLLALTGLFFLPAAALTLLLLALPTSPAWQAVFAGVAVLLLLLNGVGSGAAQEACHLLGEERTPSPGRCLAAAMQRHLGHLTAEALMLALPVCCLMWLVLPGASAAVRVVLAVFTAGLFVPVWMMGLCRHAALTAGKRGAWRAWRGASQIGSRYPATALLLLTARGALLLFAVINLHLFARFLLWAGQDLAGLDVALAGVVCSLDNPTYLVAIFCLAWWLLAPYAEAVTYLFFVDARVRHEGLDLAYRVEELMPVQQQQPTAAAKNGAALLALAALLVLPGAARADTLDDVRQARKSITAIRAQVDGAGKGGGGEWVGPLKEIGGRLDGQQKRGFDWFHKEAERFGQLDRRGASEALERIDRRLAAVEDSLVRLREQKGRTADEIKALVSPEARVRKPRPVQVEEDRDRKKVEEKPPPRNVEDGDGGRFRRRAGPALVGGGASFGGIGQVLMVLVIGVGVALLALVVALLVRDWLKNRKPKPVRQQGAAAAPAEEENNPERADLENPDRMWHDADALARSGNFLGAVRALYLSVLGLLHRGGLIRYERTRTNGEYADQLRRRTELHRPFSRLTGLFELKWYGERSCREGDYQSCRELAQELRHAAGAPA